MNKIFFFCLVGLSQLLSHSAYSQRFLTDMMDTSTNVGKGIYPLYQKHDRLRFGGYMQPQFQMAEEKGARTYSGGDFSPNTSKRFMLRRGRIRVDYSHYREDGKPLALFAFQFDGTERGVAIRDFWGRFYENKVELFSLTGGMFARPMGFEVNLSSSDREAPERGRMSQILMRTERDLGIMLTLEPRRKDHLLKLLRVDLGVFNGQGLAGPMEYDDHKDVIGRVSMKPKVIGKSGWRLSGGVSGYLGGIVSQSSEIFRTEGSGISSRMVRDSIPGNVGYVAPRRYAGADVQLKIPNKVGFTEFRAEYIRGLQTATATTSETPGTYPIDDNSVVVPLYTRSFDGAYFYFLQHLGRKDLQLVLKYDWYDPNKKVKNSEVNTLNGFSSADIRYNTFGGGLVYYVNLHVKATLFYDLVNNERSGIAGYLEDQRDNVLTLRLQFRF